MIQYVRYFLTRQKTGIDACLPCLNDFFTKSQNYFYCTVIDKGGKKARQFQINQISSSNPVNPVVLMLSKL